MPVLSTAKMLKKGIDEKAGAVIIDLRAADMAAKSHIPGAVTLPAASIAEAKASFPKSKGAPIILYADTTQTGLDSFSTVRSWGYKNTSVLKGGFTGWQKAGMVTESGKLATKIVYVPKQKPGTVKVAAFKKAASDPTNNVILDVRMEEEAEEGMIKGALNIPADEVAERLAEIPKGKPIVIHCSTGVRAEMAFDTLKEQGIKSKYLLANVKVAKDGTFEVTKE